MSMTSVRPAEGYFTRRGLTEEQALENQYASRMRALWLGVIERAILDVVEKTGKVNEQASAWLAGGPDFLKVCELEGVERFYMRGLIRKRLEARKAATASEPHNQADPAQQSCKEAMGGVPCRTGACSGLFTEP